jgi:anti-sigma B factor antagonist
MMRGMRAPLKLMETSTAADACTLTLDGELDLATAPEFRAAIGGLLGTGCRHIEIDLSETTFLDSSGLGALVWALHRLHAAGGDLHVVNAVDQVAQTMRLTGVEQMLAAH